MTDVRERVARAILAVENNVNADAAWPVLSESTKSILVAKADAALAEIGFEELVAALHKMTGGIPLQILAYGRASACEQDRKTWDDDLAFAEAALSKARGTT